jgi:hypothetical protein
MARSARWMPLAATVAVAAMLTGAAAMTVEQAGCDDPGSWVLKSEGARLVGGCLDSADLPVAPPAEPGPAQPASLGH